MKLSSIFLVALISTAASAQHRVRGNSRSSTQVKRALKSKSDSKSDSKSGGSKKGDSDDDSNEYFLTADMGPYPGTKVGAGSDVSGSVNLHFNADGTFLTKLNVEGLLADCTNCGVHVHEGTSCAEATLPGGHYWDNTLLGAEDDPWQFVAYNATTDGTSTSGFYIDTGFDLRMNDGHAVVIHTAGGVRIGCGVLEKQKVHSMLFDSLKAQDVGAYNGYTGGLEPAGKVEVDVLGDSLLKFSFDMEGLAPNCEKCGVHIHAGLTCDEATMVLGHYWDTTEQVLDPWVSNFGSVYNTDSDGEAKGFFYVFSGYNFAENEGHAIVFHDQDGARVACGVLKE